jgi:hypothetical protein
MTLTSFFHYLLVRPRWHRGMPGGGKGDRIGGPGHAIVQNCHRALSIISCELQKDVKKDVK